MSDYRKIILNGEVRNNSKGYDTLCRIASSMFNDPRYIENPKNIIFDCIDLRWFGGSMVAPLGALIWKYNRETNKTTGFQSLRSEHKNLFKRNRLIQGYQEDKNRTVIPLRGFGSNEQRKFEVYSNQYFQDKDMPDMSDGVQAKFFESLSEIFINASLFSRTDHPITCCGQFFPRKHLLAFSIVDVGVGILETVRTKMSNIKNSMDAIDWAVVELNTSREGDVPGGLGLALIKEFIEKNEGKLIIVSHDGYWQLDKIGVSKRKLDPIFPGTIVSLEINTSDVKSYFLTEELSPKDIF